MLYECKGAKHSELTFSHYAKKLAGSKVSHFYTLSTGLGKIYFTYMAYSRHRLSVTQLAAKLHLLRNIDLQAQSQSALLS